MENRTSDLIKGRNKLRYFTNDEGTAVSQIKEVFSVRDIDEFFDGISQTKLDSGFLSPLPKSTPGAGAEEEDAPEAERVALPADDKTIGENGLTDKESSFKDSVPLKTSSPIAVAPSIHEAGDEEKPLGSPLLLADDNEDPIEGNMDHKEDLVRESSFVESSLTPPKRFTLGVRTQQRDKSPVFTVLARRNHERPEQKNVPVASESHTLIGAQMDGESLMQTSVSTQTAQSVVKAIKESDSSLKSSSATDEQSFQKKLREFMAPKVTERARLPVPVRAPSPQELDDDDFLFLEDDAPLLFSLKRKTQSQRQTSKKAETETRTTTGDGASSENELGTGGNTASTSEPPPKGPATHKKRGKQGKPTDAGEGASTEAHEVGGNTDGVAPAEPPPAAPSTQKKRGKQGQQTEKGASGDAPGVGRDPAEAAPPEPPLKAPAAQKKRGKQGKPTDAGEGASAEAHEVGGNTDGVAPAEPPPAAPSTQKKRGKQKERAATESLTAEKPDGRMGSTGLKRCPVTPGSKPLAPAPADNAVQQKARQKGPSKHKPFLSTNKKKKKIHSRLSEWYSVTSSPDREHKSNVQMSKAASITASPESTGQATDAAPSQASPKAKSRQKEKESKRAKLVQPEESEAGGASPAQQDSPQGGGDSDATGETEAGQQELSLDLSGSSALGKRKRSKPGSWWALNPDKENDNDALASSPLKRQKKSKREDGKKPKKMGKEVESREEDSSSVIEEGRNQAGLPQQQMDKKAVSKSRQKRVKGDSRPNQRKPQTDKDRRRRPQEEATSAPPNQLEEEEEERMAVAAAGADSEQTGSELQVNMSSEAPAEPAQTSSDDEVVSRPDVPQPRGRTRRGPSNWWEGQQLQPQPAEDIIPSPSPPRSFPEPRPRVATPGMPVGALHQRAGKLASGSQKPCNHLKKNPVRRQAGTPKTRKGSLTAFGAIYTSGKTAVRNTATRKVRKNLLNSLEDSSSRSMDGSSYDRLNGDHVNQEACDRVSNSVVLEAVVQLKSGDLVPASDWPSQNLSAPGLKSGPSSMVELRSFEEEEDQIAALPSTLRVPMALSEGDICGPLLRPLTLVPDDWQNLTYWLRQVWRTSVKYAGQVVTADHFHWYTHEGRALGHKFDLQCTTYANGKLLLGSYMRKPAQVDQHTTTVFNVYTSSVRVQIKDLRSDYNPGQAFVVPRGQSYSIRNLTPVPAILWYHRMFADLTEDS
ncbi:nucleolar protein dao-5 isoform X2 [Clupea harengus]|uniref:Nucleolar protein dao-5 isoform X2 n=1 Tax=Clupea harengus TaxID=7950 RepID=A0A6P8GYK9_CLUHA|nr:nucleolar protein dao-5 isoform X2 [Clupea harengus]